LRPPRTTPPAPAPWFPSARRRIGARLRNPLLHTLAIRDIALLPRGEAFWAPGAERVAVVALADGLCGYATVGRLPRTAREELIRAVADECGVATVRFVRCSVARQRAADACAVIGQSCIATGLFALLLVSPVVATLVLLAGLIAAHLAERFAGCSQPGCPW
jgi:hypothetical protein